MVFVSGGGSYEVHITNPSGEPLELRGSPGRCLGEPGLRPVPGASALTVDHPLAHDCPECRAPAGFFCVPVREDERPLCPTHRTRHAAAGAAVHDPDECYLCGSDLSAWSHLPAPQRIGKVGGFELTDDGGRVHIGSLCHSCWFPDGFWRAVEKKMRERAVGEQMELFR